MGVLLIVSTRSLEVLGALLEWAASSDVIICFPSACSAVGVHLIHVLLAGLALEFAGEHSRVDRTFLDSAVAVRLGLFCIMVYRRHLGFTFFILDGEVLRVGVIGRAVPQNWWAHAQKLLLSLDMLLGCSSIAWVYLLIVYALGCRHSAGRSLLEIRLYDSILYIGVTISR